MGLSESIDVISSIYCVTWQQIGNKRHFNIWSYEQKILPKMTKNDNWQKCRIICTHLRPTLACQLLHPWGAVHANASRSKMWKLEGLKMCILNVHLEKACTHKKWMNFQRNSEQPFFIYFILVKYNPQYDWLEVRGQNLLEIFQLWKYFWLSSGRKQYFVLICIIISQAKGKAPCTKGHRCG